MKRRERTGELDEVLFAIDDAERAVAVPLANVACHEPAVLVDDLLRQVGSLDCKSESVSSFPRRSSERTRDAQ